METFTIKRLQLATWEHIDANIDSVGVENKYMNTAKKGMAMSVSSYRAITRARNLYEEEGRFVVHAMPEKYRGTSLLPPDSSVEVSGSAIHRENRSSAKNEVTV